MGNLTSLEFDASQEEEMASFEPLPSGWYEAMIVDSEMKTTKKGDGQFLSLKLQVVDSNNSGYDGRLLFDNLNLDNPNPKAVEIAKKQLTSICKAVGVLSPQDSSELHDKVLKVKVGIKPATDQYPAGNKIDQYAESDLISNKKPKQNNTKAKKPWE